MSTSLHTNVIARPKVCNPDASASDYVDVSTYIVRPYSGWRFAPVKEIFRQHELLWILSLRDVRVRYKQTVVGMLWAVLQPIGTMVVFTLLFQLMGRFPTETGPVPYAITLYCSLLPWQFFSKSVTQASESLIANQGLVTKVYFPRMIIPLASIMTGLVDFAIAFLILVGMVAWHRIAPTAAVFALPLFILMLAMVTMTVGVWFSALTTIYRDVRFIVPYLVQLGFYISPVVFETKSLIPERWQFLFSLNPITGVLDGFRWSILGGPPPIWSAMFVSIVLVSFLLAGGLFYFRRAERFFADRI